MKIPLTVTILLLVVGSVLLGLLIEDRWGVLAIISQEDINDLGYNFSISEPILKELSDKWESTDTEYAYALSGRSNVIYTNDNYESGYNKVELNSIDEITLGSKVQVSQICKSIACLHNHPHGGCMASQDDLRVFQYRINNYASQYMLIQCDKDKFAVYSYIEPGRVMIYEI